MSEDVNRLDEILKKVRALVALADHENTPPHEAELARQRADALMLKYRIDEATQVASGMFGDGEGGLKPVWRTVALYGYGNEFETYYRMISGAITQHVGVRGVTSYDDGTVVLNAVGYESDLRYMDLLLTSALLEFGKRLEPREDPSKSFDENCYTMRHAGMERKRIAKILLGDWDTENEMKAKNRKVSAAVKRECAKRGEDPNVLLGRGNNMKTYRESYADGFVSTLHLRLWRMRQAQGEEGSSLVLADRSERVDEALYERYPHMRPRPTKPRDCAKCRAAKSGYCRDHKPVYGRVKQRSINMAARERGSTAAAMIDLGAQSTGTRKASAPTRKEIG